MHRLLPLLLLACANSKPAEYERGTYRPAPPVFSPSQDAPHTTGQPGHLRQPQEYPRSPHARPLPPSAEPGLWAGDRPMGSASPGAQPSLLGVPLPFHEGAATDTDRHPVRFCAQALNAAMAHLSATGRLPAAPPGSSRPCGAAALLLQCVKEDTDEKARKSASPTREEWALRRAYSKAYEGALVFFMAKCGAALPTQQEIEFYEAVLAEWRTVKRSVQ